MEWQLHATKRARYISKIASCELLRAVRCNCLAHRPFNDSGLTEGLLRTVAGLGCQLPDERFAGRLAHALAHAVEHLRSAWASDQNIAMLADSVCSATQQMTRLTNHVLGHGGNRTTWDACLR